MAALSVLMCVDCKVDCTGANVNWKKRLADGSFKVYARCDECNRTRRRWDEVLKGDPAIKTKREALDAKGRTKFVADTNHIMAEDMATAFEAYAEEARP